MACIISISSDEDDFTDDGRQAKKRKLDTSDTIEHVNGKADNVIVLDDDEDMKSKIIVTNRGLKEKCKPINCSKNTSHFDRNLKDIRTVKDYCKVAKVDEQNNILDEVLKAKEGNRFEETSTEITISNSVEDLLNVSDALVNLEGVKPIQGDNEIELSSDSEVDKLNEDGENNEIVEAEQSNPGPSTSKSATEAFANCKPMQELVNICLSQIKNVDVKILFKSKIPICESIFEKVGEEYTKSDSFLKELDEQITLCKKSPFVAIQCFNGIYKLLKSQRKNNGSAESPDIKHRKIIRKLEHMLNKLRKKIKELEVQEINFEEEEDSCYLQLCRYTERAAKVFEKLCKYRNEDPHYDSIMHNRLDFSASNVPEVNKAINRKFKNNMCFPTYFDIVKCLKKCVETNNIQMTEAELQVEARHCFEKLGNLIQHRRKVDLVDVHSYYVPSNQDPAAEDPDLNCKLNSNLQTAQAKIDEICQKYTRLQEAGDTPQVSSDSDDSNAPESEDENNS